MNAVKFADQTRTALDIRLVPFGGSINGRDTSKEYFSAKTNLCLDWFPDRRPMLYNHGLDNNIQTATVGYIESVEVKADGAWARAQLDAHNEYYSEIVGLIDQGVLGASSGAMAHLVKKNAKTGHIDVWPLVEGSLTPTPCEPLLATVDFATAKAHFKSAGLPTAALERIEAHDLEDDAPDTHYLHVGNGKSYGLYRDATGTVDPTLLDAALKAVDGSDLPEAVKLAVLTQGRAIAAEHGMTTITQVVGVTASAPGTKAVWTTAFMNDLPDSAFLYVEPGGSKDGDGKTTPRSLRHFPYKGSDGTVDLPHLRNALARIPQSTLPDDIKERIANKARRIAKANGIEAEAAKAVLSVLDHAGDDETGYEGSYEDLRADLSSLLNPSTPWANQGYTSIIATYPTYVIACHYGDDDDTYWRVPYVVNTMGDVTLGDAMQVEQTYVPVKTFSQIGPLVLDAQAVAQSAAALVTRTEDVYGRRTKDGRMFSTANTKELLAAAEQSIGAGRKIKDLVQSAGQAREEAAKAAALLSPEGRARELALLALAIP